MDSVASRFFLLSGLVVGVVILVALPNPVNSQEAEERLSLGRRCYPSCTRRTPDIGSRSGADLEDAKRALEDNHDIRDRIEELKAADQLKARETGIGSRCPCGGKCRVKTEPIIYCDGCRVFWPFNGIADVTCGEQRTCSLGAPGLCGCTGRCAPQGPRRQWVVLYCPRKTPVPFDIKQITLCSTCCCQNARLSPFF